MYNLEGLKIYQKLVDLYYYTYMITKKFPKDEKVGIVSDIKNTLLKCLDRLINAQKEFNVKSRKDYLTEMDVELKVLKVLVRVSYKFEYITKRNYGAWSRKILNVSNMVGAWLKYDKNH